MFIPRYQITDLILSRLSEISQIKTMVESSRILPAREAFLRKMAVVKMAHTSTSIEGNTLAEYQVQRLVEGGKVKAREDQVREVKNYLAALRKVDRMGSFGVSEVLEVQKTVVSGLVEREKAGVFRKGAVYVVNEWPDGRQEVAYTPPGAGEVEGLVRKLIAWLGEAREVHPIIRAGIFHYQFETIHPFTDGNGRTGRLLTLLYLYQSGWDFKKTLVLEDYYNQERKRYYQALQTGKNYAQREQADLTGWLEYFVEGFWGETLRIREQILMMQGRGKGKSGQVLDLDELKIVDFVVTVGKITSTDVVEVLGVPQRTAQAKLKRLVEKQVLSKKGAGPGTYYEVVKI